MCSYQNWANAAVCWPSKVCRRIMPETIRVMRKIWPVPQAIPPNWKSSVCQQSISLECEQSHRNIISFTFILPTNYPTIEHHPSIITKLMRTLILLSYPISSTENCTVFTWCRCLVPRWLFLTAMLDNSWRSASQNSLAIQQSQH